MFKNISRQNFTKLEFSVFSNFTASNFSLVIILRRKCKIITVSKKVAKKFRIIFPSKQTNAFCIIDFLFFWSTSNVLTRFPHLRFRFIPTLTLRNVVTYLSAGNDGVTIGARIYCLQQTTNCQKILSLLKVQHSKFRPKQHHVLCYGSKPQT